MARILIIEDSPTQSAAIVRLVQKLGHAAIVAHDGQAGLAAAKKEKPDLVLMDIILPLVNGFQATRTLSSDPETRHIPIVMVTTKDQVTDKAWGMRQGAKAYITKPFKDEELAAVISQWLPRR